MGCSIKSPKEQAGSNPAPWTNIRIIKLISNWYKGEKMTKQIEKEAIKRLIADHDEEYQEIVADLELEVEKYGEILK